MRLGNLRRKKARPPPLRLDSGSSGASSSSPSNSTRTTSLRSSSTTTVLTHINSDDDEEQEVRGTRALPLSAYSSSSTPSSRTGSFRRLGSSSSATRSSASRFQTSPATPPSWSPSRFQTSPVTPPPTRFQHSPVTPPPNPSVSPSHYPKGPSPSPNWQQQRRQLPNTPVTPPPNPINCSSSPSSTVQYPGNNNHLAYLASRRQQRRLSSPTGSVVRATPPVTKSTTQPSQARRQSTSSSNFLELPAVQLGGRRWRSKRSSLPVVAFGCQHLRAISGIPSRDGSGRETNLFGCDDDDNSSCDEEDNQQTYTLRQFRLMKNNRVVSCGDCLRTRSTSSSIASSLASSSASPITSAASSPSCGGTHRVLMLGSSSVGKSALVQQFMTSEYANAFDASLDNDFGESSVNVLLDSVETELTFIDHPAEEMSTENALSTYRVQGALVVYSITDRRSYTAAAETLRLISDNNARENSSQGMACILVGNKCDLERARVVSVQEGRSLATTYRCKFIETSPGLQHNTDELLVGILKQIRLRAGAPGGSIIGTVNANEAQSATGGGGFSCTKKGNQYASAVLRDLFLGSLFQDVKKSRSCQNLHAL